MMFNPFSKIIPHSKVFLQAGAKSGITWRLLGVWLVVTSLSTPLLYAANEPLTLQACYAMALKRSETLATKAYLIKEAEGEFLQSLSTALPQVSYKYDVGYKENSHHSELGRFTLSQPLFSGFKEFAAIAGAKAQQEQKTLEHLRAKELLFIDVADAYYLYWLYLRDQETVSQVIKALVDQQAELKKRVTLGRARASELAAIDARLSKQQAVLIQSHTDGLVSRHLLEFLIGASIDQPLDVNHFPSSTSRQISDFENLATQRRDVQAAQKALVVAQKKVVAAKAGFWPKVSVDGDYYTRKSSSTPQDWDLMLKVDVPIFQGTENFGLVKQAKAQYEEAKLALSESQRRALMEVRQAFDQWQGATARLDAFDKAKNAADKNYQWQEQDYQNRLISVLDFLQALADKQESYRDWWLAQSEAARAWWNLKVKAGDVDDVHF